MVFEVVEHLVNSDQRTPSSAPIVSFMALRVNSPPRAEWQQPLQTAIEQYHYGSRNGPTELEKGFDWSPVVTELQRRGHQIETRDITSGLHGIQRDGKFWRSGTDPRREGVASGE